MGKRKIDAVLDLVKRTLGVATDREMCEKIGWKYATLDTWKARDAIPKKRIYELSERLGIPVEAIERAGESDGGIRVSEPNLSYFGSCLPSTVSVPVLSATASAGGGNNVESIDVYESGRSLSVDREFFGGVSLERVRAIEVEGYSMVPVLLPGSWVFFEEGTPWSGDGLYVLIFRGVLMVKIVEANPATGQLRIRSANPDYESWDYDPTEDQSVFRIVGRVRRVMM